MSDDQQYDYQKYLTQLKTVKKEDSDRVSNSSDEFQMEKNETQYSGQQQYHSELDEFVIPPKEQDSVSIDTKPYESIEIVKPKMLTSVVNYLKILQLPSLSKKIQNTAMRHFQFKNVEVNQQMLKYETLFYEIESYFSEDCRSIVNRQYSDFEWLHQELFDNFPGVIIPSIPSRTVLAKLNIMNYTASIRAQRQKGLEEFLRKVLSHPKISDCQIVDRFMTYQDQDFKKLMQDYQAQKYQKLSINVSRSTVVNSLGKLTSYIFGQGQGDNELHRFFQVVMSEINNQRGKIKNLRDTVEMTFNQKHEQSKQLLSLSNIFEEIQIEIHHKDKLDKKCEQSANSLKESYDKVIEVIQILDQLILDMDVVQNVINRKEDLQNLIADHAGALNSNKYNPEQKALIQTQLNEHQRTMSKLIENFKPEYDLFATKFNEFLNQLIMGINSQWNEINAQLFQIWN